MCEFTIKCEIISLVYRVFMGFCYVNSEYESVDQRPTLPSEMSNEDAKDKPYHSMIWHEIATAAGARQSKQGCVK